MTFNRPGDLHSLYLKSSNRIANDKSISQAERAQFPIFSFLVMTIIGDGNIANLRTHSHITLASREITET